MQATTDRARELVRKIPFMVSQFLLCCALGHAEETYYDCLIEPHLVVKVGSHTQGIIRDIPVRRGDSIEVGQLLANLDSEVEEVAIELATARLEFLEEQYQRLNKLKDRDMVSAEELDEVKIERRMASLELKRNKILLQQKRISSPVKGVVIDTLLSPGEYVHEQSPVLEVAQTDPLNVEVLLPVSRYQELALGRRAEVSLAEPVGGVYIAEVDVIDRVLDAASSSFGVRFSLPNPDLSIPAGLRCSVRFTDELAPAGDEALSSNSRQDSRTP
jgi:RND family efflux transporter MFP subunit